MSSLVMLLRSSLRSRSRTARSNAYSDEILHDARLSPIALTHKLTPEQWDRLFTSTRATLQRWIDRLDAEANADFPTGVTAFRGAAANRFSAFATPTTKRTIAADDELLFSRERPCFGGNPAVWEKCLCRVEMSRSRLLSSSRSDSGAGG